MEVATRVRSTATLVLGAMFLTSPFAVAQSSNGCGLLGTPQVEPALISLTNRVSEAGHRRRGRLHAELTLRAGVDGVYLPDYFGPFLETCSHGFSTVILTEQGKPTEQSVTGCATAGQPPRVAYVHLRPGEIRTWSTDLSITSIPPGRYCVYAEYLSPGSLISQGEGLSQPKELVASGRITAIPIVIRIGHNGWLRESRDGQRRLANADSLRE